MGMSRRGAAAAMARKTPIAAAAPTMLDGVREEWDGGGFTLPKQRRHVDLYRWRRRGAALVSRGLMRSSFWLMRRELVSRG